MNTQRRKIRDKAVEILKMIEEGMNASVEYYAKSNRIDFWHHYNRVS